MTIIIHDWTVIVALGLLLLALGPGGALAWMLRRGWWRMQRKGR